ncbi:ABC transporter ATP-binding protein [Roseburia sp. BX1005]|uniref:ABC transporter ATP-binding protein n=1 Tax=Roseburia zhanii TaxID=2763064 RepID=A0A923RSP5_9FIRM|nr:ABC transporter ATP-binding protein [Roseburia zhanii]MBC5713857.1 ABC transporter ATP-binding protein [Roseburia zhanii]
MGIIELEHINKYYQMGENQLHVLKDVSLTVEQGDYLAILGPSGSGKSTLMNVIGCMDHADSGEYVLDGEIIHKAKESELTKIRNEKIGFIFQKYHLIPTYNVLQNIVMPLLMRGMKLKDAKNESLEIIEMLGLKKRMKHRPSELSGGQQQRVAIARALVGQPAILLADEPTGALDKNSGTEVLKLFQRLNDMGNTIVMITHDLEVATHAKRIAKIVDGELTLDA